MITIKLTKHYIGGINLDLRKLKYPSLENEFKANFLGRFAPLMLCDNINDMTEWFTERMHKTTQEVSGKRTLYRNDNGFNAAP